MPVTQVYYGRQYDYTGSVIDRDGSESSVYFYTNDGNIYSYGYNYAYVPGYKHTESVKNGKLSLNMLAKNDDAYPYLYSLEDGAYDSQITCKSGLTLAQTLMDWDPYINDYATSFKSQSSFSHTNSTSEPATGEYKAKYSASGELQQPGACTIKGELFTADYSLTCAPVKTIKVKVTASASGTSVLD